MYTQIKKNISIPCYFNFKVISLNNKFIKKKIITIIKKKKIKKYNLEKKFSKKKKYITITVNIFIKKFKYIKYFYKNFKNIKYVKIIL